MTISVEPKSGWHGHFELKDDKIASVAATGVGKESSAEQSTRTDSAQHWASCGKIKQSAQKDRGLRQCYATGQPLSAAVAVDPRSD